MKTNFILFLSTFILLFTLNQCDKTKKTNALNLNNLGKNVFVFSDDMDMKKIQHITDSIYHLQSNKESEFNTNRFAFLFKPGLYQLDIKVGYYTQVMGLGTSPNDVVITGSVQSESPPSFNGSVLINFWRSIENLTIEPTHHSTNKWAVSQAAPIRRVHIKGNLQLHDNGAASGGFMADSKIDGNVDFSPQQQWFSRNSEWKNCSGGLWNMVSLGVTGAPDEDWPNKPYLSIKKTPFIREKPFLALDNNGNLVVNVPLLKKNTSGISWDDKNKNNYKQIAFSDFYIAKPELDNAQTINIALQQGKNILFTPGIYWLKQSLEVTKPGTMLIGIGLPSLIPQKGQTAIQVADVDNVAISSILVDAGLLKSENLIQIGEPNCKADHSKNPTFIYDLFFRVGGYHAGTTEKCLTINSNNVVVDHIWLWRADHGNGAGWEINKAANGLTVNGDNVTIYGLFNEHFQEYQTIWNGENGKVYFYQSEMPYFVPSPDKWTHNDINGFASYKVADNVTNHEAWGLGIYNVFFKSPVVVDQAVEAPNSLEANFHHIKTVWLGGNPESEVKSIINGKGKAVNKTNRIAIMSLIIDEL